MRIYLSGWQSSTKVRESAVLAANVVKHRCFSFCNVQKLPGLPYHIKGVEEAYGACKEAGVGLMMDSGVVGYRSYRQSLMRKGDTKKLAKLATEDEFILQYVDYCGKEKKNWDFYITIDIEKQSDLILKTHKRLLDLGITPVPVLHGDSDVLEYLRKYHDMGHKLVALGTGGHRRNIPRNYRHYLDSVFNGGAKLGVEFHGLAMTSAWIMIEYPWFSVDSSSWSQFATYGIIISFNTDREYLSTFHISSRDSSVRLKEKQMKANPTFIKVLKKQIEREGYDYEALANDLTPRHIYNAVAMQKLCDYATQKHRRSWNLLF